MLQSAFGKCEVYLVSFAVNSLSYHTFNNSDHPSLKINNSTMVTDKIFMLSGPINHIQTFILRYRS